MLQLPVHLRISSKAYSATANTQSRLNMSYLFLAFILVSNYAAKGSSSDIIGDAPRRRIGNATACYVKNAMTSFQHITRVRNQSRWLRQVLPGKMINTEIVEKIYNPIIYCRDKDTYRRLDESWTSGCVTFQCTRDGIATLRQNSPQLHCQYLNTSANLQELCRNVIVQDDDGCCRGLECTRPGILEPIFGVPNCPPGWIEVNITGLVANANSMCLKFSASKKEYDAAAKDCRSQMASLINVRAISGLLPVLSSLKKNLGTTNTTYFWTGLHSRGNFYYWDNFMEIEPDSYISACSNGTRSGNTTYGWDCEEPGPKGSCARAKFVKNTIIFSGIGCGYQQHYTCIKYAPRDLLRDTCLMPGTSACPGGWLFSSDSKRCYKFFEEKKNAFEAIVSCRDFNASLAMATDVIQEGVIIKAIPDGQPIVPREVHGGVCNSIGSNLCTLLDPPLRARFNNDTIVGSKCIAIRNFRLPWNTETYRVASLSSCFRRLPFVCEIPASGSTLRSLKVYPPGDETCQAEAGVFNKCGGDSYSWIVDGLYTRSRQLDGVTASACYTTDTASGERIYSPFKITGPLAASTPVDSLVFTTNLQLISNEVANCKEYAFGDFPSNLSQIVSDIFFIHTVVMPIESWTATRPWPVTCRTLRSTKVNIIAHATFSKFGLSRRQVQERGSRSTIEVNEYIEVDRLASVIEKELKRAWSSPNKPYDLPSVNLTNLADSIRVRSLRFCNPETIATNDLGNVTTPRAAIDSWYNLSLCVSTRRPILAMYCQPDFVAGASWTAVIKSQCPDVMSSSELELKLLLIEQKKNITARKFLSSALSIFVNSSDKSGVTVSEIIDLSSLVKNTVDAFGNNMLQRDTMREISETIPAIVSLVMSSSREQIMQAEDISQSSTLLTQSLEKFTGMMSNRLEQLTDGYTIERVEDNLAIQVTRDPNIIGVGLPPASVISNSQVTEIRLDNEDILKNYTAQITVSLPAESYKKSFIVYKNNKLFSGRTRIAASDVILSASLEGEFPFADRDDLVRTSFNIMGLRLTELECGFWSYDISDWSTDGCKRIHISGETITCYCNHTTSFAALMRPKLGTPNETHESVLTIVTVVGLSISIASLLLVMATFLMFKKMRQTISQKVLFNLSLAVFSLDVTFLIGIDMQESKIACAVFSALLHYFLLSSFSWMAVEAVLQYFRFVKVIGAYVPRFIVKASVPAWGMPAIIVGVICAKDYREYLRDDGICWVNETVLYYGVLLPISIVMAFNSVVFGLIIRALLCRKNTLLRSNQSEKQLMRLHLRAAIAVLAVMGLTWIFGFLMLQQTEWFGIICQYLFCIFNSAQGFLIMIFHCIREKTVIDAWKNVFAHRKAVLKSEDVSTAIGHTHDLQGTKTEESLIPNAHFHVLEERM